MARSLWTGSLSFGLVNVPVALFSAVRDVDLHFHQLHEKDGARIDVRRFCSEEDREVAFDELGHGYELDDGSQVVAHVSASLRLGVGRILPGDRVRVELSGFDRSRGRITHRTR